MRIEKGQIKILEQIKFKTDSAEILPDSDGILDAVAEILEGSPRDPATCGSRATPTTSAGRRTTRS